MFYQLYIIVPIPIPIPLSEPSVPLAFQGALTTVSRIDVGLADRRSPKIVITLRHTYPQATRVEHRSALELECLNGYHFLVYSLLH